MMRSVHTSVDIRRAPGGVPGSPPAEQAAATPADQGCPIGLTVLTLIFATIDPCAQGRPE
jgi:hypothetical protein